MTNVIGKSLQSNRKQECTPITRIYSSKNPKEDCELNMELASLKIPTRVEGTAIYCSLLLCLALCQVFLKCYLNWCYHMNHFWNVDPGAEYLLFKCLMREGGKEREKTGPYHSKRTSTYIKHPGGIANSTWQVKQNEG